MVIVRLLGGLGNQMFQYALGRVISMRTGAPLVLDKFLLEDHRPGLHLTNRNYGLGIFSLEANFARRDDVRRYHSFGTGKLGKAHFHLRKRLASAGLLPARLGPLEMLHENGFRFDPTVLCAKPPVYLEGLWQSWRYLEEQQSQIRQDLTFRHSLGAAGEALVRKLGEVNSVVLHIRRGDYVSVAENADLLGFVGLDYYRDAIAQIRSVIDKPRFFVFSDDLGWSRKELPQLGIEAEYVDMRAPDGVPQHAFEMQLMSRGANLIIANSTFSWWAAWLAADSARNVLAPARWFADNSVDTSDLIPPNWRTV
ncbi:hypothetical protein MGEO_03020 [Marivita geojedonensis]|uniref:Alpha-1,2-fucosyltransferase n=2 Tax=Marivita geojedonensis TaxID=1123756 RepID=A0A1X4NRE0_9RHOB|nr:hypothetical protein MGEO_03020 [Marivita geojedonensis]PRY81482.1 glycosyl transferase family 11 [Marivita geojedonensis]